MVFPAVIGAVGTLGSGALGFAGAGSANRANRRMSREQMDFQREAMRDQMGFQERMSNTAYQRAVQDMTAAGINPMLAYMQGGASSPSGSVVGGSTADMKNKLGAGVSSALQAASVQAVIDQNKAMTALLKADLPEKEASAKIYSSRVGPFLKAIKDLFNPTASLIKSIR